MKKLAMIIVTFFLMIPLASANHFLGRQSTEGFGGHPPDCGQSFKGPYRGMGDSFDKKPFSSLFFSTTAFAYSPIYIFSTTSECADLE